MVSITKTATITITLKSANMQDDGQLSTIFDVYTDDVITNALGLLIPAEAATAIMDATITDGKSIRDAMTERIYSYFLGTGQIIGTLTV